MNKSHKKVFKTKDADDKEVELAVLNPTAEVHQKARRVYARAWKEAVEDGAMMSEALDRYLREQKLWDDRRDKEYKELRAKILDGEMRLRKGGNAGLTKKTARELSLDLIDWRDKMGDLLTERNRVGANTADAIAEQAQFNYYVAACTVYNDTGKPVFTSNGTEPSVSNYLERAREKLARDAAGKYAEIHYDTDSSSIDKTPEKTFLKQHGFMDDKGRLINKDGHLIDREGRLIDENSRYVNEAGEFVDVDGNRVDEDGQYVVDFAPFLPDDDEEVKLNIPQESPALPVEPAPVEEPAGK